MTSVRRSKPQSVVSDATQRGQRFRGVNGQRVYAVGDIHGRYDLLVDLLGQLARDCSEPDEHTAPLIVFCGDYVDRGPDSAKVLEALVWLKSRNEFRLRFLKGNHEQALLHFLDDPEAGQKWLEFGGAETLRSYGVELPSLDDGKAGLVRARDELLMCMPASHLRFLQLAELLVEVGDYAFVHAGVKPGRALSRQTEDDLLWIRADFIADTGPFEKVIVHGHTWFDEKPRILSHRIAVDTGAYLTGVLTAVRIEDHGIRVLQACGAPGLEATPPDMPLHTSQVAAERPDGTSAP